MTTREKLQALLEGKKLRDPGWDNGDYISIVNDELCAHDGGQVYTDVIDDATMIYTESHDFAWAREQVENGRAVRRSDWGDGIVWDSHRDLAFRLPCCHTTDFPLLIKDLDANDWELA